MLTEGNRNVSERRRFRGCGAGLGRLGFAGGLGVMEAASAASLGPIGRYRFWGLKLTRGFHLNGSFFARLKEDDFGGVGWVWGAWASRVGWCGAVLRVWARLADFDLGSN